MYAFVTTTTARLSSHRYVRPQLVSTKQSLTNSSVYHTPRATYMQLRSAQEDDPAAFEDDDATMGTIGPVYGMQMPSLSPEDKTFLDGATTGDEYMRRMTQIARKMDSRRKRTIGAGDVTDNYMSSLSRPRTPTPDGSLKPRVGAGDAYLADLADKSRKENEARADNIKEDEAHNPWVNEGDRYFENLARARRGEKLIEVTFSPETAHRKQKPVVANQSFTGQKMNATEEEPSENIDNEIAALQQQLIEIQDDVTTGGAETEPTVNESTNPEAMDKQIQFLEHYLTQLKEEEEVEHIPLDAKASAELQEVKEQLLRHTSQPGIAPGREPEIKGLEDTPGEMSMEDKIAAFQALRRQAQETTTRSDIADPLNIVLPEKQEKGNDGDEPSADSLEEYEALGSDTGDKNLIVEEIETEIKTYLQDTKALLTKHESRMNLLLARLRML